MAFNIVLYAYAIIGHSQANQLLPQLLMEQFDTLPLQCRHIEHMHERVWFRKNNLTKWHLWELRQISPIRAFVYALMVPSWADQLLPQLFREQFDTLPIQCRNIEHMHEGVWFRNFFFWHNDSCENNFSLIMLLYVHRWCLHGPINSYHSFWWSNLILYLFNIDTLNIYRSLVQKK